MQKRNSPWRKPLKAAFQSALSYLEDLDRHPVGATSDVNLLRTSLDKPISNEGIPPEEVVIELIKDVERGILGSAGGRFYGWVIGGSLPAALAADWLTSVWD